MSGVIFLSTFQALRCNVNYLPGIHVHKDNNFYLKKKKIVITFYNRIVPMGFLPREILVAFPGESPLRQIRTTQPRVRAGCFCVSIVHRTLTWTTGPLMCAQM